MVYRVVVSDRAERDADLVVRWLAKRSPRGAARWILAFDGAKEKLAVNPFIYALAPESHRFSVDLRHIFFKTQRGKIYRAAFTVVGEEARILRVRGPHQRLLRRKDLPTD